MVFIFLASKFPSYIKLQSMVFLKHVFKDFQFWLQTFFANKNDFFPKSYNLNNDLKTTCKMIARLQKEMSKQSFMDFDKILFFNCFVEKIEGKGDIWPHL